MWLSWHLKGALTWSEYLDLPRFDRDLICRTLAEHIERHNAAAS